MVLPQGPRHSLVEGVISNPRPSFRLCPRPTSASPAPSVSQLGSPSPHGRQSCVCYRSLAPQVPTRARYSVAGLVIKYPSPGQRVEKRPYAPPGWLQSTRAPGGTAGRVGYSVPEPPKLRRPRLSVSWGWLHRTRAPTETAWQGPRSTGPKPC